MQLTNGGADSMQVERGGGGKEGAVANAFDGRMGRLKPRLSRDVILCGGSVGKNQELGDKSPTHCNIYTKEKKTDGHRTFNRF